MITRARVQRMEDILKDSPDPIKIVSAPKITKKKVPNKTASVIPEPEEKSMKNTIESTINEVTVASKDTKKKKPEVKPIIPKGKPKSGRIWKSEKKKFSSIIKTKGIRNSFEKKQLLRQKLKDIKELSKSIKSAKEEENEARKQRRRENLKRQEENRKRSEVVQVITNTKKLKNIKKKHLRTIEKRDTTVVSK
ncbi:unnamed protein product [Phaedon cochleariae]|uniref:Coiled-coil domain-containing protein 86 n=1 Tax=Phaedon cochleariae TaxID=80249 RepID=A0A9P0DDR6_PHACE|nr:unnamed protein product [Phaedon cochleariae]